MNIKYYKDFCGVTASIKTNSDGSATLTVNANGAKHISKHKNERAAYQAWRRWCN